MPLQVEQYGDVLRLRMHSIGSRLARLDVSAYVIRSVMIDSGFPRAWRELERAVDERGIRGAIITHWHEDHAGNVAPLAARGFPILMRGDTDATLRSLPPIRLYRRAVWGHPSTLTAAVSPFDTDGMVGIHTPGHSEDHQVVWDPMTRTIFSGDLWLGVRSRIVHTHEDPYMIIRSLRTVLALEPERMFDAHRGMVANPTRAIAAKIDWLGETLATIEQRIAAGWSDRAIVRRVLGGEEPAAIVSRGEYARRNLVAAVRARTTPGRP